MNAKEFCACLKARLPDGAVVIWQPEDRKNYKEYPVVRIDMDGLCWADSVREITPAVADSIATLASVAFGRAISKRQMMQEGDSEEEANARLVDISIAKHRWSLQR